MNSFNTNVHLLTTDNLLRTEQTSSRHTRTLTENVSQVPAASVVGARAGQALQEWVENSNTVFTHFALKAEMIILKLFSLSRLSTYVIKQT